jgi:uncharacterized membrane protein
MTISSYFPISTVATCIATLAAVIVGVNRALKRSHWDEGERKRTVQTVAAVLIGWFVVATTLAFLGVYRGAPRRLPTIEFGIVIPILVGCLIIWRWSALSRLIDSVPRQWVIAVQFYRVEGAIFLMLYASNLLPGPFALPAGVGDVTVGILALAIGINTSGDRQLTSRTVLRWNLFGLADLIIALATGFLTSPSPFQMFAFDHPNELISVFPLVLIPTFLVPLAIILHIFSLLQLRRFTESSNHEGAIKRAPVSVGMP